MLGMSKDTQGKIDVRLQLMILVDMSYMRDLILEKWQLILLTVQRCSSAVPNILHVPDKSC
jgi:hypothetical protein